MKKIKVAFIGTGYMGQEHLKVFSKIKKLKIVGIINKTRSKSILISKKYNIRVIGKTITEMLNKTKPDLVVVAVPELNLKKVCLEAFKYKCKFLIEKPVGFNFEEALYLEKLAKKHGIKAYPAFNRRHFQSTLKASEELKKDKSRRIINILDQQSIADAIKSGQPKLVAENFMYANSIHLIDYINIFCRGKIKKIYKLNTWKKSKKKFVLSKIDFTSGDSAIYQADWQGPGPWSVTVTTANKRLEMSPLETLTIQKKGSRKKIKSVFKKKIDEKFKPGLVLQAKEMIKSIKNVKNRLPILADGVKTMKLIKEIYDL